MKISVISLFPELIRSYLSDALIAKAITAGLLKIEVVNLRDFSDNKYKSVDDSPFGGGDGMLMRPDILESALKSVFAQETQNKTCVIYLSPQGRRLEQATVKTYAADRETHYILICGRYAGVDERFIQKYVNEELSIGDYVLSGGELPALVFIEAVSRFVPGVLGQMESAENDSFAQSLLEAPQYTRPQLWNEMKVPDVLLSGNHQKIGEWKQAMAIQTTIKKRPDILNENNLTDEQRKKLKGLKL